MQQKRKVLITTDSIGRGGKERQIFIIARELLSRGYDIIIVSLNESSFSYVDEYFFPIERIKYLKGNKFIKLISLFKIISSNKNSIILAFDTISAFICLVSYKLFNIVFINCSIRHGIRLKKFSHYFRSFVARLSPYVIANSYAGLKANKLKKNSRRFVLYNGNPQIGKVLISPERKNYLRENLFGHIIQSHDLVFISVANFVPYKDYFTVFKALEKFKKKRKFYYIIIGDGIKRKQIEEEIKIRGLENVVILIGQTKKVFDYLLASDVFIHSSKGEGLSNAILESLIAGLPVIATDVGGNREILHPEYSRLFAYRDYLGLYKILETELNILLENTKDKSVFTPVLNNFRVEVMIDNLEKILNKAVT